MRFAIFVACVLLLQTQNLNAGTPSKSVTLKPVIIKVVNDNNQKVNLIETQFLNKPFREWDKTYAITEFTGALLACPFDHDQATFDFDRLESAGEKKGVADFIEFIAEKGLMVVINFSLPHKVSSDSADNALIRFLNQERRTSTVTFIIKESNSGPLYEFSAKRALSMKDHFTNEDRAELIDSLNNGNINSSYLSQKFGFKLAEYQTYGQVEVKIGDAAPVELDKLVQSLFEK